MPRQKGVDIGLFVALRDGAGCRGQPCGPIPSSLQDSINEAIIARFSRPGIGACKESVLAVQSLSSSSAHVGQARRVHYRWHV